MGASTRQIDDGPRLMQLKKDNSERDFSGRNLPSTLALVVVLATLFIITTQNCSMFFAWHVPVGNGTDAELNHIHDI